MISRFAGNGNFCAHPPDCGDLGPATSAQLTAPAGVAVDAADDVFIADTGDNEIRVVEPNGLIGRLAGDGTPCGDPSHCSDGQFATTAQLRAPMGVAVASDGTVYIADTGDNEVRAVRLGDIFRWAGNGKHCRTAPGCGDDDYAPFAELSAPTGVAVDRSGDVYIADSDDGEVRKVQVSDEITRIAGAGTRCGDAPTCGDGGDAKQAELSFPAGIAVDSAENVYIADTQDHEIRKLG
jgi:DNA-binding beta-propeller fold protein YncE